MSYEEKYQPIQFMVTQTLLALYEKEAFLATSDFVFILDIVINRDFGRRICPYTQGKVI